MAFASCLDAIVEMLQMHARLKCCTGVGSIRHARFRAPSCHISPPPRCHKQTTSCRPSCAWSARTPCQGPLPSSSRRGFPPTRCREAELPIISPDLLWSHCRMIRLARRAACSPGLHTPLRVPELVLASLLPPRPGSSPARLASRTAAASACLGVTCLGIRL